MAGEAFDSQGNAGKTSYLTLPFVSQVYYDSWGSSPNLSPANLFFQANPASIFLNPSIMANARGAAAGLEANGLIPASGAQRWEDTYEASFPAGTFKNEPSWIQADRSSGNFPNMPEFVAWRNFITNNPEYWDVAFDGGTMPAEPGYFRSWGGQWGHIDPVTPLNPGDCPPDITYTNGCKWGDSYAYGWGQTAALSGAYGIMLSDFIDSEPGRTLNTHNFNQRILTAFAKSLNGNGQPLYPNGIPGSTIAAQASYLVAHDFNRWVDFNAIGYGQFYGILAWRLGSATNRTGLVIDQCGETPSIRRLYAIDQRIIAQSMPNKEYLCLWDDQVIQPGRGGPVLYPPVQELSGPVLAAAREPLLRNGANLESDDAAYWSAIASFYPSLSASVQKEIGYKLLKRTWIWSSWAHIADRSGNIRRALAFMSRDYWDAGSLTASQLGSMQTAIQSVVPTKPFGPAIYYSATIERTVEQVQAAAAGAGIYSPWNLYMAAADLGNFLDSGSAAGYYVSDAALSTISKSAGNAPFAWMVIDPTNALPNWEESELAASAPVVKSAGQLAALPNKPLTFPAGLTGFGFYDQDGRLVVVTSNPSTAAGAAALSGQIKISGTSFSNGNHTWTNLLTGAKGSVSFSGGAAVMSQSIARWDTQVYAFDP